MVKGADSVTPSPNGGSQKEHTQVIKDTFEQMRTFSSSATLKGALMILDEMAGLRVQLGEREKELAQAREEATKKEEAHNTAISEMVKANQKEIAKQETILAQVKSLEAAVEEKEKLLREKASKTTELNEQIKELRELCKAEKAKLEKANEDITKLQNKLKEKDNLVDQMKKAGSELKKKSATQGTEIKQLSTKAASLESSLKSSQDELQSFRGLIAGYHEEDEGAMIDRFDDLWDYATKEIYSLIKEDLPDQTLQNSRAWNHFRKETEEIVGRHSVTIMPSNTNAAKGMRLVIILALLARLIDSRLFQPTYILPPDGDFRDFSANLAQQDSEKESFCRSLLLSVKPEVQNEKREEGVKEVVKTVSSSFALILPDEKRNEMQQILEKIVQKAADIWSPLQRAKTRYETDFEPLLWGDHDWVPFEFPDIPTSEELQGLQENGGGHEKVLLTVFPRISRIADGVRDGITVVHQLLSSAPLCLAAEREGTPEPPSPLGRRFPTKQRVRRQSFQTNGTG